MPTARRTAIVTLVAAATLAAATTVVLLTAPPPVTPVAMPPDDATPQQVVDAYTRALAGHDCATARALRAEGDASWCADVASLTDVRVGEPNVEDPQYSGHTPDQEVTYVPVTFDLDWRPFQGDGSMPEGLTTWGYLLVRDTGTDPWRIFDEGVG